MRKLIMFIFCLLSLFTMIMFTISISELFNLLGLGTFELKEIISIIKEMPLEDAIPAIGVVMRGLFQVFGIPLIVFLVSLNGLFSK